MVGRVCVEGSINQEVIESTMAKVLRIRKRAKFPKLITKTFIVTFAIKLIRIVYRRRGHGCLIPSICDNDV